MENLNYAFFEEFKRLDKLCGEIYNAAHGITNYIDDMKAKSWSHYRFVSNWNTDLEQLIRLRHVRNQLAHTEGAFYAAACTQHDIDWIRNFHKRILSQSDPLAVLYRELQIRTQWSKQFNTNFQRDGQSQTKIQASGQYTYNQKNNRNNKKARTLLRVRILLTGFVVILAVIMIIITA